MDGDVRASPLVRRFVEMHGGRVTIWSRPEEGSRFTLILPGVRPADEVAGPRPAKAEPQPATPAPAAPEPAATPGEEATPQTTETVADARQGKGQPLAEGPGYSITKGEPVAPPPSLEGPGYTITRDEPRAASTQQSTPNAEAIASNAEKRTDPIICQGDRLMRIDGESIDFEGDAVIAGPYSDVCHLQHLECCCW